MNKLKVSSPCSLLGLSVLMSFFWISSGAAETVLKTQRFVLTPQNATSVVQFTVPGPGNLTLEVAAAYPLNKIGLIARGADPTGTDIRKDGSTPLRLDFPVAAQNLTKGNVWTVFTTIMGTNGMIYAIPCTAAIVDLKVSFVIQCAGAENRAGAKDCTELGWRGDGDRQGRGGPTRIGRGDGDRQGWVGPTRRA